MKIRKNKNGLLTIHLNSEESEVLLRTAKQYYEDGIEWGEVADYGRVITREVFQQVKT